MTPPNVETRWWRSSTEYRRATRETHVIDDRDDGDIAARPDPDAPSPGTQADVDRLSAELTRSEARVDLILDAMTDGFVAVDADFRYVLVNPAAEQMLHKAAEELIGRRLPDVFPDINGLPRYIQVMETRVPDRFETYSKPTDAWVEVHVYPTDPGGLAVFATDITERKAAEARFALANARLDAHIENSPLAIIEFDPDFRVTRWSGEAERMFGWTAAEVVGKTISEFPWVYEEDVELVDGVSADLIQGGAVSGLTVNRNYRKDGSVITCEWYNSAVHDADGQLASVLSQVLDVTERETRRALDQAFGRIATAANSSLEPEDVLRTVLELGAEAIGADAGVVTLLRRGHWVVTQAHGLPEGIAMTTFAYDELSGMKAAAGAGAPVVFDDAPNDPEVDQRTQSRLGGRSFVAIPLMSQGEVTGGMAFIHRSERREITDAHVAFLTRLQALVALALDNARLYQREHRIAETLQDALLTEPEDVEGVAISYVYRPASNAASVGGDFFDAFLLEEGRVALLVGDVSGKGLDAARLTAMVRDGARSYALEGHDTGEVLARLNELLHRFSPVDSFVTAFFGVLDTRDGGLEYSSGGHPAAVVRRAESIELLESRSSVVGAFQGCDFEVCRTSLEAGDVLVLYTDGLVEARSKGELYGEERLVRAIDVDREVELARLPQALVDDALAFADGPLRDDTIVLCVEVTGDGHSQGADPARG